MENIEKPELIFLDTETTDLKEWSRVIQLAYQYWWMLVNEMYNPERPIWLWAMAIHHITDEDVKDKPTFVNSFWAAKLMALLNTPNTIVVAHNAEFDIWMLKTEWLQVKRYICTKKLAEVLREKWLISPDSCSLQYLRYYFQCRFDQRIDPHDALSDIIVLRAVFDKLKDYFADINEMLDLSTRPVIIKTMWFGKYKWKTFEQVAKEDRQYLERLKSSMEKDWDITYKDKDRYYTILHRLTN